MYWISLAFICISAVADPDGNQSLSAFMEYHLTIGIPRAARIKEIERQIMEGAADGINYRFYGGYPTMHERYPWMVGLIINLILPPTFLHPTSVCEGALLDEKRVLTAARCVAEQGRKMKHVEVVLGSNYLYYGGLRTNESWVPTIVTHPSWRRAAYNNRTDTGIDAAIVFIPDISYFYRYRPPIKTVTLPPRRWAGIGKPLYESFEGYSAQTASYGATTHYKPYSIYLLVMPKSNLQVEVEVQADGECTLKNHPPWYLCTSGRLIDGKVGTCIGDVGAPLTVTICGKNILIGIATWYAIKDCEAGGSSYFVRVTEILDFISDNINPPS